MHSWITVYVHVGLHGLDCGPKLAVCSCSQRRCEPQLVRVIAIIMSLSKPDSLLLSTQACVCVCVHVYLSHCGHTKKERVEDGTMLSEKYKHIHTFFFVFLSFY